MSEEKTESLSRVFWSAYKDHHPDAAIVSFDELPEDDQPAIEAGAHAVAAHVVNPTAEDYDHAAEILKLREVITEVLAEFGQHYCDDPACESSVRIPTARLTRWRERAGLADQ